MAKTLPKETVRKIIDLTSVLMLPDSEIAKVLGIAESSVHKYRSEAKIESVQVRQQKADAKKIAALARVGVTDKEIAKIVNRNKRAVRLLRVKSGEALPFDETMRRRWPVLTDPSKMTAQELATYWKVTVDCIYKQVKVGRIPCLRGPTGMLLFDADWVDTHFLIKRKGRIKIVRRLRV